MSDGIVDERRGAVGAALLTCVFLLQVFVGSLEKSLTWDEAGYIAAGYVNWRWNDYRLNVDHPPLMQKLQGLPLLFMDVRAPDAGAPRYLEAANPRATYGRDLVFSSGNDVARIARWGRAPVMLLGALLVLCVYGWGRELFGPGPALLATAVASLSPNLVAHAKLATEDLGCAAGMFAAVWCAWRAQRAPSPARTALCGLVTGLALLTKYTALLLLPVGAILTLAVWRQGRFPLRSLALHLALLAAVATVVVGLAYGLRFRPDLFVSGALRIYPDVDPTYRFYFAGRVSEDPLWFHALVSWIAKTPLPTLALLALAVGVVARGTRRGADPWLFLLAVPLAVVFASFFDVTNPGLRRILPAVPFLLLVTGAALAGTPSRARVGVAAALVAWCALEAALVFPHHLSFLNRAFGGPERGPYWFDESNVDWGQDLPALAAWQRAHQPDEALPLLYFGSAKPAAYGVRAAELELSRIEDPPPGTYAVSAHYLAWFRKLAAEGGDADWLSRYEPVARAGHSIWIYRFPESAGRSESGGVPPSSR